MAIRRASVAGKQRPGKRRRGVEASRVRRARRTGRGGAEAAVLCGVLRVARRHQITPTIAPVPEAPPPYRRGIQFMQITGAAAKTPIKTAIIACASGVLECADREAPWTLTCRPIGATHRRTV